MPGVFYIKLFKLGPIHTAVSYGVLVFPVTFPSISTGLPSLFFACLAPWSVLYPFYHHLHGYSNKTVCIIEPCIFHII